jgi:hypothetical protein
VRPLGDLNVVFTLSWLTPGVTTRARSGEVDVVVVVRAALEPVAADALDQSSGGSSRVISRPSSSMTSSIAAALARVTSLSSRN